MPKKSKVYLDRLLGLEAYISETDGIGGVIRRRIDDFVVKEITMEGITCSPIAKFEEGVGEYVWFVLEKRGVDSITALRIIARSLGISSKRFSIAGLKDSKAVTFQLACVRDVDPDMLTRFKGTDKVKVHCVFRRPFRLTPGLLMGNRFEIVIREIECKDPLNRVNAILNEIEKAGGVPNYYGYQRFGTIRPITHLIGKRILLGDFKGAVETLLTKIFPHESEKAKEARRYLAETWDVRGALELFPRSLHHERMILYYLSKHPGDHVGAIRTLPIEVRRLFIGAYQAYLFNKVLSKRILEGMSIVYAVPGDLVALGDPFKGEIRGLVRATDSNRDKLNQLIREGNAYLVLNVFGYGTSLCYGRPGEIEREVLREEGISLDAFKLRQLREASSHGTFRPASFKPRDLSFKLANENSIQISFTLGKGMYATVFLRELMKPEDVVAAGF